MGKVVDITDKLDMNAEAALLVAGKEIRVNSDAATALKIMGLSRRTDLTEGDVILEMYDHVFPDEAKEVIESLSLTVKDLRVVIEAAMSLINGSEDETEADPGEDQTHTTT